MGDQDRYFMVTEFIFLKSVIDVWAKTENKLKYGHHPHSIAYIEDVDPISTVAEVTFLIIMLL